MERGNAEWTERYKVTGSVIITPGTLHMEVAIKGHKCIADATGIFTESGKEGVELEEARLGTNDLRKLCARGTRFFFTLTPTCFEVAFYDEQQQERKLGELRACPLRVVGNPGSGLARWSAGTDRGPKVKGWIACFAPPGVIE